MPVCKFFLQGRCLYGDKCWNEHPRGGGGGYNNYNRSSPPQQSRGGGGYGNKVWVNPSQQKGGFNQQQHSSLRDPRGNIGQDVKSSDFSFSSQNRFSALGNNNNFESERRGGGGREATVAGEEDDEQKLEIIQSDMKAWESSGQWGFSCYGSFKTQLSGFTDLSPEELRLEYYSTKASGDMQSYVSGVNLLLSQWRNRIQELLRMNPATRAALLAELKNPSHQASPSGFGSTASGFGSSSFGQGSTGFGAAPVQASINFSFAAPAGGFGSSPAPISKPTFGSAISAPTGFGAPSSSSAFGSSAPSAASFSFASPASNQPAAPSSGFGSAGGFSFSSTTNNKGSFGSGFGSEAPAGSLFGQSSSSTSASGGASDMLFSPESELSPEELEQFKAQRFTLGHIPLKPPPAEMLRV
ncbi:nucleoporin NUP42 isoform X1 [Syngnathus typhle]|uniref:nucleoporin NUP42 isoform X1 n=1 Tax=Syngnathus typhle TaxID=161592 RepID=UPI002A6A3E9B|nr:nucleoporin NUP42 isoform X1 [Syngnathus typhle]